MKIMHIISGLNIGGAEKVVFDLSRFQARNGCVVSIVSLANHKDMDYSFINEGLSVEYIGLGFTRKIFANISKIISVCKRFSPDVIHLHMFYPLLLLPIKHFLTNGKNTPFFFTSHSYKIGSKYREIIAWMLRSYRSADIVFSENMDGFFYKRRHRYIIPNGVEISKYQLDIDKRSVFTFICVARLEKVKNQASIIKAALRLKEEGYVFNVLLVGTGREEMHLSLLIKENGLENIVILMGSSDKIPELLSESHCFILPSLWEGLPISLLEAAASGLPIITTRVGSIPEFFDERLVEFTSAFNVYAAMKNVMNNYNLYKDKGVRLKSYVKEFFELESIVKQHMNLYLKYII